MKPHVALLTREFPPEVYGGAGVHVEYLSRELARLVDVSVFCFGAERQSELVAASYQPWDEIPAHRHGSALRTMSVGLRMAADVEGVDLVHSHTLRLARYRCENCGFKARQFYWHCPACGGWETYPPRRTEEERSQIRPRHATLREPWVTADANPSRGLLRTGPRWTEAG